MAFSAENTGFVGNKISISAETVIGRDSITIYEAETAGKAGFIAIKKTAYSRERFIPPLFTATLLECTQVCHLILLAGGSDFDKCSFIRQFAIMLSDQHDNMPVLEWQGDSAQPGEISDALRRSQIASVFILQRATPAQLGYNVAKLAALAKQFRHYFLLSTDISAVAWPEPETLLRPYWFTVPEHGLYDTAQLTALVIQKLGDFAEQLQIPAINPLQPGSLIGRQYSPEEIAVRCSSPDQINLFFSFLENHPALAPEERMATAFSLLNTSQETKFLRWFASLSNAGKQAAMCAILLEDLYEDQFFSAMQQLCALTWHSTDPLLLSPDHHTIAFLYPFFGFVVYEDGRSVLSARFPGLRLQFLRACWNSHKRHILSAVIAITEFNRPENQLGPVADLTDSVEKKRRLLKVTANALELTGYLSLPDIENKLTVLALSENETLQEIAASAIMAWKKTDKATQLYYMLDKWLQKTESTILLTGIRTLDLLLVYDSSPAALEHIHRYAARLAEDERLSNALQLLVYKMVLLNPEQAGVLMEHSFALNPSYTHCLAAALYRLYDKMPATVKTVLEKWLHASFSADGKKQENLIRLVLLTYRSITYTGKKDAITYENAWQAVRQIARLSLHESGYRFLFQTAAYLVLALPQQALLHAANLFEELDTEKQMQLALNFGRIYLQQREASGSGDCVVKVKGTSYASWHKSLRPLTLLEEILFQWLAGNSTAARQLATLSFIAFARLLDYEELLMQPWQAGRPLMQNRPPVKAAYIKHLVPIRHYEKLRIALRFFFRNSIEKAIISEVINTVLAYDQADPVLLPVVARHWRNQQTALLLKLASSLEWVCKR